MVAAVHPKAMPVILTRPDDWETWLQAPWQEAASLQRPLDDAVLEPFSPADQTDKPDQTDKTDETGTLPLLFDAPAAKDGG